MVHGELRRGPQLVDVARRLEDLRSPSTPGTPRWRSRRAARARPRGSARNRSPRASPRCRPRVAGARPSRPPTRSATNRPDRGSGRASSAGTVARAVCHTPVRLTSMFTSHTSSGVSHAVGPPRDDPRRRDHRHRARRTVPRPVARHRRGRRAHGRRPGWRSRPGRTTATHFGQFGLGRHRVRQRRVVAAHVDGDTAEPVGREAPRHRCADAASCARHQRDGSTTISHPASLTRRRLSRSTTSANAAAPSSALAAGGVPEDAVRGHRSRCRRPRRSVRARDHGRTSPGLGPVHTDDLGAQRQQQRRLGPAGVGVGSRDAARDDEHAPTLGLDTGGHPPQRRLVAAVSVDQHHRRRSGRPSERAPSGRARARPVRC